MNTNMSRQLKIDLRKLPLSLSKFHNYYYFSCKAKTVLGWTDADIALLTNWGPIAFVVSAPFFSWVMDVKG